LLVRVRVVAVLAAAAVLGAIVPLSAQKTLGLVLVQKVHLQLLRVITL
tara:strand:+ start:189 stop:332 length:144 start_codon:yes stop_codon:yes gene_type:complete